MVAAFDLQSLDQYNNTKLSARDVVVLGQESLFQLNTILLSQGERLTLRTRKGWGLHKLHLTSSHSEPSFSFREEVLTTNKLNPRERQKTDGDAQ